MAPVFIHLTIAHRQYRFGKLGGHSHQAGNPHPKQRAGATSAHCQRYTADITHANGGRQRGHQGIEWADIPLAIAFAATEQLPQTVTQTMQRHELEAEHQIDAGTYQQKQHQ